jgi:hypothetical protein
MAFRVRARLFEGPLVDEVQLANDARKILNRYQQYPLTANQLQQLAVQQSADLAARVFYESLLVSKHGDFFNTLNNHAADCVEHTANIKLWIVPGMFYREHPDMGGGGLMIRQVAEKFGFQVDIIPTQSTASVSRNSAIIKQTLAQDTAQNIWLLSISKGMSELRHYLQNHTVNPNVKGCIHIAGIPKGVPYIDDRLSNPLKRSFVKLLCQLYRVDYQAVNELQTTHVFWENSTWENTIQHIQLLPIPHSSHLHGIMRKKYHLTLKCGPNDGMIPLTDCLDIPGNIYPVWGYDHFLRTPQLSAYLYRLLNYIACQTNH